MSEQELETAFENASTAKQGLADLNASSAQRAQLVDSTEDAALFIEELGEKFELESICENLSDV